MERWNCAVYLRLSKDDENKGESNSIGTQKMIISRFIEKNPQLFVGDFYVDDGFSGTNFDRPNFARMIEDIKSAKINCVIVKDLSRFGRNYYETGRYLEAVFQLLRVRFISVNDRIDSFLNPASLQNASVSLKNVINDEYARDISNKIRSVLTAKRKKGQFIGSFAPFGYKKDCENRNKLVVDENAAEIVREIFELFLGGESMLSIARRLTKNGIANPSQYRNGKCGEPWHESSVRRILKNRVYLGEMAQKKTEVLSYKVAVLVNIPKEKWIIVKDTHEAIVPREAFERVVELLAKKTRTSSKANTVGVFAGMIFCADCGKPMIKKTITQPNKKYDYYCCSSYRRLHQCTKHTTKAEVLEKTVLTVLQKQISLAVEMDNLIKNIDVSAKKAEAKTRISNAIANVEKNRAKAFRILGEIYPDFKEGLIGREQYLHLKAEYEKKLVDFDEQLGSLRVELSNEGAKRNEFLENFRRFGNITTLNRQITTMLIDSIRIHEGGEIEISLKFRDEFFAAKSWV